MPFKPPISLVLEGTVFKKADTILFDMIRSGLGEEYDIIIPKHDPVTGAVLFALENAGIKAECFIKEKLFVSYEHKKNEHGPHSTF